MIFSNTEFYYTPPELVSSESLIIIGDEANHILKVMRHKINDEIFVTNGKGKVFKTIIKNITKKEVIGDITKTFTVENKLANITFCIPLLKSSDRLEFALEKCVELGITNFIIFSAKRSYKRGVKLTRWQRILISAMKQSLQAHKPNIIFSESLFNELNENTKIIILEQNSDITLESYLGNKIVKEIKKEKTYFVFGPEGGLTDDELNLNNQNLKIRLTKNRLRAETAIITAAACIASKLNE